MIDSRFEKQRRTEVLCIGTSDRITVSRMSLTSRGWINPTDQIQQELVDEVNWIVTKVVLKKVF